MSASRELALFFVFLTVFIDVLGASIVIPVLPFYALSFGINISRIGVLFAAYSFTQIISAYALGRISDCYSRRFAFLLSLFGSFVGFLITGFAFDFYTLLLGRMLTGILSGSPGISQAYIADVATIAERPRYMAMSGSIIAISFLFGPAIGSGLSQFSLATPMFVASGLALLGLILSYFLLIDSKEFMAKSLETEPIGENSPTDKKTEKKTKIRYKVLFSICAVQFFSRVSFSAFAALIALFGRDSIGLSSLEIGFVFSGTAVMFLITQMFGFNVLSKRISLFSIAGLGSGILCVGMGVLGLAADGNLVAYLLGIGVVFIGFPLVVPAIPTLLSMFSTHETNGKVLSYGQQTISLALVVGPLIFSALYESYGAKAFLLASVFAVISGVLCLILRVSIKVSDGVIPKTLFEKVSTMFVTPEEEEKWSLLDEEAREEAHQFGDYICRMLSYRNYDWINHQPAVKGMISQLFPSVRTGDKHLEDIEMVVNRVYELNQ